ncbi:HPP family protein [Hymenobacter sp. BT559]|jgi:CBS-domain-containing membrane protein|uniref:HPP family protein n=1 Tax=Hymenobacter sp. BT559 TaxID=2795729 RepID=UPI0018ECE8DC|nr:HPP family protein [Hymenobacter sp. BT559]MBJ6142186.1 HPP family protein [Hymenobacter sp. BT559]
MRTPLRRHTRRIKVIVYQETLFDYKEHCWTFLGAFLGIGLVGLLSQYRLAPVDAPLLIGSFGASSVLIYGVINSPLAQPRNLVGGHVLSAFIGVTVHQLVPQPLWLAAALAVSLAIVGMQITKTLHPPGGATALIAIIGSPQLKALGYWYVIAPVLAGAVLLLLVAVVVNKLAPTRHYPANKNWYRVWRRTYPPAGL